MNVDGSHMKAMTAEELAGAAGTTKAQILAYENGHRVPDPPRIKALARALHIHPRLLMNPEKRGNWAIADAARMRAARRRRRARTRRIPEGATLRRAAVDAEHLQKRLRKVGRILAKVTVAADDVIDAEVVEDDEARG